MYKTEKTFFGDRFKAQGRKINQSIRQSCEKSEVYPRLVKNWLIPKKKF